jgi:hypothetical protein
MKPQHVTFNLTAVDCVIPLGEGMIGGSARFEDKALITGYNYEILVTSLVYVLVLG